MQHTPALPDYMIYKLTDGDEQPGMYWGCKIHPHDFGYWFTENAPHEAMEEALRHARQAHGWEPGVITMSSEEN